MPRWLQAEYREFHDDVPRMMVCTGREGTFLFYSRFDAASDAYLDHYEVYRLPSESDSEPCAAWFGLETRALERLADLPIREFPFDAERRGFMPYDSIVERLRCRGARRMKLREVLPDDTETLFDIRCSVVENHQSREELATIGVTVENVRRMVGSGDYVSTLAEHDGLAVGFSMAQLSAGYVFACFVRPGCEGRGVGRALMTAAEEGMRRAGVSEAWLSTGSEPGLRAAGFYRHLGWLENGRLDDGQLRFVKSLRAGSAS
jgi:ribosomal protein S18 acetylase RimI-like enzyme